MRKLCSVDVEYLEKREVLSTSPALVAAYSFNEGTGTVLHDSSGNGNNGVISNAAWSTAGNFGTALSFNGNTNSYVSIPDTASLDLSSGMTVEAWLDPLTLKSANQGWSAVISKEHVNSSNDASYGLYAASGTGTPPGAQVLVGGTEYSVQGLRKLPLNTWTFLAATYDGSNLRMYVNGNLVATHSITGHLLTTSDPLMIGGGWAGEMFTGMIDNVRIYNTALTRAQIRSDMITPVVPTAKGLTLNPATLPAATVNSPYSATVGVLGGSGTYTFAVSSGSLPSWLTLNASTGVLSGTPTAAGTSSFTITATDSKTSGLTGSQTYTLTVNPASSLTIIPATLPSATVNSPYNVPLVVAGGSGWYQLTVSAGSLPPGITLGMGGTPTTAGTYSFTLTATDDITGQTGSQAYTLTVNPATTQDPPPPSSLTINPATLPGATVNSAYNTTVSATGGSGTYTFAVSSGSLPSWLTLNATTGVLTGTPTAAGTSSFTITATDSKTNGLTGSQTYTLTVNPASSLTISPSTLPSATVNSAYSATVSATGGSGSYTFAATSAMPSWLSLNASTGVLSGTPTTSGTWTFTISATDSKTAGLTGSQTYTLVANAAASLAIIPATLSSATVNSPYNVPLVIAGGSGWYQLTVSAGSLPPGITLGMGGTPTTAGTYSFTLTATDDITGQTGSQAYTLTVNPATTQDPPPPSSLTINPATLPGATVNSAYNTTVSATGGSGTYTFAVSSGSLPSWLTLNATTGVLTGTPTAAGTSSFTITATDSKTNGLTGSQTYTLTVNPGNTLTVGPATLSSATVNSAYSATVSATGGSGSYTFAATSAMPSWLSLNASTGVLSGTPTTSGTWTFTISATDSKTAGLTGSQAYTLVVNAASSPPPPVNSGPPPVGGATPPVTSATITTPYLTIPNFGANPTIYSVASGNWSNPGTWSLGRVPTTGDIVDINPGTTVTYDVYSTAALNTLEIQPTATLTFRTDVNTQVVVGNFLVLEGGTLQVGTAANPIADNVVANINLGNVPFNTATDPQQFGDGLIVLGNVTMHGPVKTPYATLSQEPHAGDTVLHLASPVTGWQAGDDPFLPDTRQLNDNTRGANYQPQWERVTIQSVSADGLTVYLTAPLKYNHLGARDANGVLTFLPQVMNDSRNIMVQSENMTGIRGYTLYTNRANVDIEYAGFCELGRTLNADPSGTNIADRYAMTMLDLIGPTTPQANGHQFTLLGNEVDNDGDGNASNPSNIQWGIALNNSFYGLIQYNDVCFVAGAGIGVEDGASSYNVFDHNFVAGITGTGGRTDRQQQGDAYWFHNPNNVITNNLAADIDTDAAGAYGYGFDVDATFSKDGGGVGKQAIPAYQGADPSIAGQSITVDMNDTPLLQFAGNQVYTALDGYTMWWIGTFGDNWYADAKPSTVKDCSVWNQSVFGVFSYPVNNFTFDHFVVRGDWSQLNNPIDYSTGIYFADYMTRNLTIQNCDIQGEATSIFAPFMSGWTNWNSSPGTVTIQNSFLDGNTNIYISPVRSVNGSTGLCGMNYYINNVTFGTPAQAPAGSSYNIRMDYNPGTVLGSPDYAAIQQIFVTGYNGISGKNFRVYYNQTAPANATTMAGISGNVVAT